MTYKANAKGYEEIQKIALTLINVSSYPSELMPDLAEWQLVNIEFDQSSSYRTGIFKIKRKVPPQATFTAIVRRGACGEYSEFAKSVLNELGYQCRVAHNFGEDHVWNEVLINGSWVHFDSSLNRETCYNNPGNYERLKSEGGWDKNLSYVYYEDENGEKRSLTNNYTETGTLVINVKKNGLPQHDVKVTIFSKFLMESEKYKSYKTPRYAIDGVTGKDGTYEHAIGGNNYKVQISWGTWIKHNKTYHLTLIENRKMTLNVDL